MRLKRLRAPVSYKQNYWVDVYKNIWETWKKSSAERERFNSERIYNLKDWLIKQHKLSGSKSKW